MAEVETPSNLKQETKEEKTKGNESLERFESKPTGIKVVRKPYICYPELSYQTKDHHERHVLDIYVPKDNPSNGPFPTIVYVHGGAFMMGDKDTHVLPLRSLDNGYAIASLNYRLSGHAPFPAGVRDCKAAVRWLRIHAKEYNLDADKFVVMGDSAGGYMTLMVAITGDIKDPLFDAGENLEVSSSVAGAIDYYGPSDFSLMDKHAPPHAVLKHDPEDSPESLFMGAHIVKIPEEVQKANPINYVHDKTPPIFIGHGEQDSVVPFLQGKIMYDALKKAGRPVTLLPVPNVDHVWRGHTDEQVKEIFAATDKYLKEVCGR